jgi:hypothetical protein
MMSVPERQHSIPDTGAETTKPDSRLMFPLSPTAQGVVDGSWWPRTRDPAVELPALIAAVTDRLGKVDRIALNADAWDTRPQRITTSGQPVVRLDWSGDWDAHTIRVTGGDSSHLDLLVIPPDTPTILARTCLAIAAAQNRSPNPRAGLCDPHPSSTPVGPAAGRAVAASAADRDGQTQQGQASHQQATPRGMVEMVDTRAGTAHCLTLAAAETACREAGTRPSAVRMCCLRR